MIKLRTQYVSKILTSFLIVAFFNLTLNSCSGDKEITEPTVEYDIVNVDQNGYAIGSTNTEGKAIIETTNFGQLEFDISNSDKQQLQNIEISLIETDSVTFIKINDPENKYSSFVYWGNPNKISNGAFQKDKYGNLYKITKQNELITIIVILVIAASTIWYGYKAASAFVEIAEFHVSDIHLDDDGLYYIKTTDEIIELILAELDLTFSSIMIVLNIFSLGSASAITATGVGLQTIGKEVFKFTIEELSSFLIEWIKEQKYEWGGLDRNSKFKVRYVPFYEAEVQQSILGLDLEYIDNTNLTAEPCPGLHTISYAGKTYNTVQIGDQCWLKENLDVGTMMQGGEDMKDGNEIEKYCYDNNLNNCDKYGGLYQWDEAMQYTTEEGAQGICPNGWHIPTYAELQTLNDAVGGNSNALKEIGQGIGNGTGTNVSGFSALLSGFHSGNSNNFGGSEISPFFWSSKENNSYEAFYMTFGHSYDDINFGDDTKKHGFSIRCLKD